MKRILVIRPGALGDALLAFPVLQALKQRASPEKVLLTLVSNPAILELAQGWDIAERTDNYSATRWSELFSTKGIRSPALAEEIAQTDLAICWLHDSDGLVGHNLRAAGCQQVIVAPGRPDDAAQPIHIVDYLGCTLDLKVDKMLPFKLASGLTPLQQARQEMIVDTQQKNGGNPPWQRWSAKMLAYREICKGNSRVATTLYTNSAFEWTGRWNTH